jgi:ceramide glucosyltransferase
MPLQILKFVTWALEFCVFAGCLYCLLATLSVRRFAHRPSLAESARPAASVLKPLCGEDPGLFENLLSFADQRYPAFEIVCGVQDPADPAIAVVERLRRERPSVPTGLAIDARGHGSNLKVGNLINMLPLAHYDLLVMVDSDMRVAPDFLATVAAELAGPEVGLVTSLYRGRPADGGLWSRLAAAHINHGFLPQAVVGERVRPGEGCFGASIAMTRTTLAAIGGLPAFADTLGEDNALGAAVRRLGKRVAVSSVLIDDWLSEPSLGALWRHELRWALTIRGIAPWGYLGSAITHPVALALVAVPVGGAGILPLAGLAVALLARFAMVRAIDRALGLPATPAWLVPVRDLLSFGVFVASFCTRTVAWRNRRFRVDRRGQLTLDGDRAA